MQSSTDNPSPGSVRFAMGGAAVKIILLDYYKVELGSGQSLEA